MLVSKIRVFLKYSNLLKKLVIRDIKVRYRKSFLGLAWTVLNPLLMMLIMNLVFSNIFKSDIENFPVYLLIGNIIFNFNSESTSQALSSIILNASLIKKIYVPKYLFPLSKVFSSVVNLGFSFVALTLVMLITRSHFYITIITLWIPLVYLMMFVIGLSLILSSVNVFFRDIGHLYSVALTAWVYLTPIFYSIDILPNNLKPLVYSNPMYHYITFFRKIILYGTFPSLIENLVCLSISVGSLLIGTLVFKKLQDYFILHI